MKSFGTGIDDAVNGEITCMVDYFEKLGFESQKIMDQKYFKLDIFDDFFLIITKYEEDIDFSFKEIDRFYLRVCSPSYDKFKKHLFNEKNINISSFGRTIGYSEKALDVTHILGVFAEGGIYIENDSSCSDLNVWLNGETVSFNLFVEQIKAIHSGEAFFELFYGIRKFNVFQNEYIASFSLVVMSEPWLFLYLASVANYKKKEIESLLLRKEIAQCFNLDRVKKNPSHYVIDKAIETYSTIKC